MMKWFVWVWAIFEKIKLAGSDQRANDRTTRTMMLTRT